MQSVEGWFNETLPPPRLKRIAFLHLDGDLYASTMDALVALYPPIQSGGLVYVDDYGSFGGCRAAVDEYSAKYGITALMNFIAEDPSLNTRLFNLHEKEQRADLMEAVWWTAK